MGLSNFLENSNMINAIQMQTNNGADATEYLINYNIKYATSGKAMFRNEVVAQTMSILLGKNKPSVLLVGSAGVGKTKIVEDIAYRIVSNDPSIPDKLADMTIYELQLSNIIAGSALLGSLEEKINLIVDFMSDPANKAILFIDEIHQLVTNDSAYEKIAQILKPALSRGAMHVIGATTLQESTNLASDPAFNRRFSRVIVDELDNKQTLEVLKSVTNDFISHYKNKVAIDPKILPDVVSIANQYSAVGNHRPDTAITLLDRTCGEAIVARKLQEYKASLDPDPSILQTIKSVPYVSITAKQLKKTAITLMTGHSKQTTLNEKHLYQKLSHIEGQDDILKDVVEALVRDNKGLYPRTKPLTFLFAGASGVGKTEVTKIIAQELTDTKPIILNMPEFHSSASINRIIGSPAGYIGSDSKSELPFDVLESNPYQIILLDEFEKADAAVQKLFLSAFDEGYIKTSRGTTIDFSKSIMIATTNAGYTTTNQNAIGFATTTDKGTLTRKMITSLTKWFPPELINRFNKIITFNPISKAIYRNILANTYKRDVARIKKEHRYIKLNDVLDDITLDKLVDETYVPEFGARPAQKTVQAYIENNA